MDLPTFLAEVVVISLSGALAPGPLTASTATLGARHGWKAGFLVSVGHTLVELPLVIAISLGVIVVFAASTIAGAVLGLIGGAFLVFFGIVMIKDSHHAELPKSTGETSVKSYSTPIGIGVTLSAFNPYFIVWWLGVGGPLIIEAIGIGGFPVLGLFYASHVWLDFVWLTFVASVSSLSRLNVKYFRIILFVLSLMVVIFGVDLLLRVSIGITIIPF
jgi:threonine/homoserine/homoserine lactone efflux protein